MNLRHPNILLSALLGLVTLGTQTAGAQNYPGSSLINSSQPAETGAPRQVASIAPFPEALRLRDAAQSNYQALQFQTAIDLYRRIAASPGADANDFYWLGESYLHARQYENAAQAFSRALTLNAAADNIRVRLVETYLAAKQPEQAKETCLNALKLIRDDYSRRQLDALMRVASIPAAALRPPKSLIKTSRTGQLEQ